MKILVLGGYGFVGRNICDALSNGEHNFIPISRRNGLDLTDLGATEKLLSGIQPDVVVNVAAEVGSLNYVTQIAADIFDVNMRMLLNVYKAVQNQIPKATVIAPIANCAYPGELSKYAEDYFWDGRVHQSVYAYGNTRRMIEVLNECYRMQFGLRSIGLFVPNMYGPYDSTDPNKAHALNALISKFVKATTQKESKVEVWGSGIAIREWLYACDFGRIIKEIMDRVDDYRFSEPFNIGQNVGISVQELVNIIVKKCEYDGEILWNRSMPDGAPRKVMDDARFRKMFPEFEFTDFEKGIGETIKYYRSIYPY
jgi:GDP-L-fucose synthase